MPSAEVLHMPSALITRHLQFRFGKTPSLVRHMCHRWSTSVSQARSVELETLRRWLVLVSLRVVALQNSWTTPQVQIFAIRKNSHYVV